VIANYAGPGIILSFLIAGLATFTAGLCYAELGARVPRSGSAYVYIYVTIGEFVAFIMGWDLILEYIIGTSSTASALSNYIDSLYGYAIRKWLTAHLPIKVIGLSEFPDLLAFAFVLMVVALLVIGVKDSTAFNNIVCIGNIAVLGLICALGLGAANFNNWSVSVKVNKFVHKLNCSIELY
jgi:solute carrier family 7 (cationic amino acid transporter), member 2